MARRQNGGAEVGLPSGFFEAEAAVSEGGSAADNPHGQTTAYFSDEALSDKASIFADHSPAAASAVRGGPSLPSGFFEVRVPPVCCMLCVSQMCVLPYEENGRVDLW